MNKNQLMLITGGVFNFAIGLTHIVIPFLGPKAYLFFGAGQDMASMAATSPLIPGAVTIIFALFFIIFGLYAFSGAEHLRRLPLLRFALAGISGVFVLRGLFVPLDIYNYLTKQEPIRFALFSLVALVVGLLHLWPTAQLWKSLKAEVKQ